MSTQVRITLHDDVYRRAKRLAQISNCNIQDLLAQAIELSLSPVGAADANYKPVSRLSDGEVLELSEIQMDARQERRFSRLLNKQQAETLNNHERSELLALMQNYQENLLRKAQALREAVKARFARAFDSLKIGNDCKRVARARAQASPALLRGLPEPAKICLRQARD